MSRLMVIWGDEQSTLINTAVYRHEPAGNRSVVKQNVHNEQQPDYGTRTEPGTFMAMLSETGSASVSAGFVQYRHSPARTVICVIAALRMRLGFG